MLLYVLIAAMTGAAALLLLWPLARLPRTPRETDDAAFYRQTLADLDRDAAGGLIGPAEAEAARAEAARRLLRSETAAPTRGVSAMASLPRRRFAAVIAVGFVPLVALALYGALGAPQLPDRPFAARRADPAAVDLAGAVARIEAHLAQNPDDGAGFEVVAPVYLRMGRLDEAVRAFSESLRLNGETPTRLADFGEALAARAGGVVSADAKERFSRAAALDPSYPKARYYLALAKEQDGDWAGAAAAFAALLADAPADAPWAESVRERLSLLRGPAAGGETIAAMPAKEREATIRGMVESLAQRLATNGGGLEDWSRLVRSYMVLGEKARAVEALSRARAALGPEAAAPLAALARELAL